MYAARSAASCPEARPAGMGGAGFWIWLRILDVVSAPDAFSSARLGADGNGDAVPATTEWQPEPVLDGNSTLPVAAGPPPPGRGGPPDPPPGGGRVGLPPVGPAR